MFRPGRIAGLNSWLSLQLLVPMGNLVVVLALRLGEAFGKRGVWSFFMLVVLSSIRVLDSGLRRAQDRRSTPA